jgi:hypothetical protein
MSELKPFPSGSPLTELPADPEQEHGFTKFHRGISEATKKAVAALEAAEKEVLKPFPTDPHGAD